MREQEDLARRSAHILGDSSAAASALDELERRRVSGEDVSIYLIDRVWVVGPTIAPDKGRVR